MPEDFLGKKILIGDNLSSHLSIHAVEVCKQNNIDFVLLPPNSTHIAQPLDVALFGPMKRGWRKILTNWKEKEGRRQANIPKEVFPRLLRQLISSFENASQNLKSGFKKCGIYPFEPQEVIKMLPPNLGHQSSPTADQVDSTLIGLLNEMRYKPPTGAMRGRKKKISTRPSKSVKGADFGGHHQESDDDQFGETALNDSVDYNF